MIPIIRLQSAKERFRFNLATETICNLCRDKAYCPSCAISDIRTNAGQIVERGINHMDCCSMQPPDTDPVLLERYSAAIDNIRSCIGTLGLLLLSPEDKALLKKTTCLEEKVPILESIAARLISDR